MKDFHSFSIKYKRGNVLKVFYLAELGSFKMVKFVCILFGMQSRNVCEERVVQLREIMWNNFANNKNEM